MKFSRFIGHRRSYNNPLLTGLIMLLAVYMIFINTKLTNKYKFLSIKYILIGLLIIFVIFVIRKIIYPRLLTIKI